MGALLVLLGAVGVAYAQGPQPPVSDRSFFEGDPCGYASPMGSGWGWGRRGFSLVDAPFLRRRPDGPGTLRALVPTRDWLRPSLLPTSAV